MHDDTNEHKRYYMGSHVFNNKEIDRTRELTVVCTLPNEEMSTLPNEEMSCSFMAAWYAMSRTPRNQTSVLVWERKMENSGQISS